MTPLIGLAIVRNSQKKEKGKKKNLVAQENPVAGFPARNCANKRGICWGVTCGKRWAAEEFEGEAQTWGSPTSASRNAKVNTSNPKKLW